VHVRAAALLMQEARISGRQPVKVLLRYWVSSASSGYL
jgi:hypothetical protein